MPKDLTVSLQNSPGKLADVLDTLGNAGINLEGVCGIPCGGEGVLHFLVDDGDAAQKAIEAGGFTVSKVREVIVLDLEDRPGELSKTCRMIADAGANLDLTYAASNTRIVLGSDDLEKVRAALA